ncbi:hypothetical protein ABGB17_22485 [Sphaerisporangium sp. B11E5]|uniref:hypothetical protein n=1 Tax=Sphaerisporangium sp. B11E5 TaxID=3153563 RepID=UPI00325CC9DB
MTRKPPIPSSTSTRRAGRTGGTVLVSHAYPEYIHQMTPNTSKTRNPPATGDTGCAPASGSVKPATSNVVNCVTVNTNTRSKNSSSVETRNSCSGEVGSTFSANHPGRRTRQ